MREVCTPAFWSTSKVAAALLRKQADPAVVSFVAMVTTNTNANQEFPPKFHLRTPLDHAARALALAHTFAAYILGPLVWCAPPSCGHRRLSRLVCGISYVLDNFCPLTSACFKVFENDTAFGDFFKSRNTNLLKKVAKQARVIYDGSLNFDLSPLFSPTEKKLFRVMRGVLDRTVPHRSLGAQYWWISQQQLPPGILSAEQKATAVVPSIQGGRALYRSNPNGFAAASDSSSSSSSAPTVRARVIGNSSNPGVPCQVDPSAALEIASIRAEVAALKAKVAALEAVNSALTTETSTLRAAQKRKRADEASSDNYDNDTDDEALGSDTIVKIEN